MTKGAKYSQISYEERVVVEKLLKVDKSKREIARVLNRSSSSICNEIRVNSVKGIYEAKKADFKSYIARYRAKSQCLKLGTNSDLAKTVNDKLVLKYSPDQISGELRNEGIICSKKAIYKYVKSRCLESKLMFKGKKRKSKWKYVKGIVDKEKRYIELRPHIYMSGHYEADFIVSKHNTHSFLVVVDKVSKYSFVRLIKDRKHITVTNAFLDIFKDVRVESITLDNDISFAHWKYLESILNTKIYFTHPYHSWEKGLVENTNRWIRLFAPKRSDLSLVTVETLEEINSFLNRKPRKILGYRTAESVYFGKRE
jgi:transposase, IS30 family